MVSRNDVTAEAGGRSILLYTTPKILLLNQTTSQYKPIVCALKNYNLNSREKFEPGRGFEPRTSRFLAWRSIRIVQVVERQARGQEVRGSNPRPGSNFSLEFKL